MTHEDYKAMLQAKALSALDADDARALDAHLEGCAECRAELDEWHEDAALLSLQVSPLEPSPEVRDRILGSVRAIGRDGKVPARADSRPGDSKVLAFERPQKRVRSYATIGAIAATLVVVGLLIALFALWRQNQAARSELARLSTQMQEVKDLLARERQAIELVTSPGARMTELSGTSVAPGARAMIAYDKKGHAMLMAKGLPAAPKGMAYQLWYIKDDKKMPGRVFSTDAAGNGTLEDQMPAEALADAVFAITLEPETGVQKPTGAIYLVSASS